MELIKDDLKKAGKTPLDYLNWLEDDRRNHNLGHLTGNLVDTEQNGGSANQIKIHPDLMDNFKEFLKQIK